MNQNAYRARILLIIGGGIAAYKCLELIRLCRKVQIGCRVIMTDAAKAFVTPLSVGALSEDKVYTQLLDLADETEMGHIQLSRSADLVVVAPATADLMAKAAHGLANDLASTTLLATDKPVLMAPAMNVRMWHHPATQRNLETLRHDDVQFVGPDEGSMACGEYGLGRMAEPTAILAAIERALIIQLAQDPTIANLRGRRVLITAGPTLEAIDPVRFLSNRSSGKQGYAIAQSLAQLGAEVHLVSGPTALPDPAGVHVTRIESARDMDLACQKRLPVDIAICVAAIADWRPQDCAPAKIKKAKDQPPPPLHLVENPDILARLSAPGALRPRLVIGFAAETNDVEMHAQAKIAKKGCDWIVANDVSGDVMGGDHNQVLLIRKGMAAQSWPSMDKHAVADALAREIALEIARNAPS